MQQGVYMNNAKDNYASAHAWLLRKIYEDDDGSDMDALCFLIKLVKARSKIMLANEPQPERTKKPGTRGLAWSEEEDRHVRDCVEKELTDPAVKITQQMIDAVAELVPSRSKASVSSRLRRAANLHHTPKGVTNEQ